MTTAMDAEYVSRRRLLAAMGAISGGVLAGCVGGGNNAGGDDGGMAGGGDSETPGDAGDQMESTEDENDGDMEDDSMSTDGRMGWQSRELTDVLTDESFSIADLDGPVVIQSFAVWCPKCQRQSEEIATLDESITRVGLNIDPNEDAAKVKQHADRNGFDWRFAVAPTEMTDALVEEFGPTVTNAPSTPVIVACDDGSTEFFSGRHNSAEELHTAADEC